MVVPTWHGTGSGFEGPVPVVRARRSPQSHSRASGERQGCGAEAQAQAQALTLSYQELLESLDTLGGLLPSLFIGRRSLPDKTVSCHGQNPGMLTSRAEHVTLALHEDSGALSLGLLEQLGHVGDLAPDTWAQSYCLMSAGGHNPPGMGQAHGAPKDLATRPP